MHEDRISITPSDQFRKNTWLTIATIFLFAICYLVLISIAGLLLYFCLYSGWHLIVSYPSLVMLAIGAGIMALGSMFFLFLIKFIFSVKRDKNPFRIEIKREDQPHIFKLIDELAKEVNTQQPKRIFLSPDMNACVFYDSSFLSMFFPVKKNLEIGMALANTLTIEEFKAVMAHELGHFSQKSMKLGSYIYLANRVIHNIVFDYDRWDRLLAQWASSGGLFSLFASFTYGMAGAVRWLLKFAYNLVNINYMKLSREMEYHADIIAANVVGEKPMISALQKLELSDLAYRETLARLGTFVQKGIVPDNLYEYHSFMISYLRQKHSDHEVADNDGSIATSYQSRIALFDQFASHPTIQERVEKLSKHNKILPTNENPAWQLFNGAESLQKDFIKNIYQFSIPPNPSGTLSIKIFEEQLIQEENKYRQPPLYQDFYLERHLEPFDLDSLSKVVPPNLVFEQLFNKKNTSTIQKYLSDKKDLEVLKQIAHKTSKVNFFEFDGKKYRKNEVGKAMAILQKEIALEKEKVHELEEKAFLFHVQKAIAVGAKDRLLELYRDLFWLQETIHSIALLSTKLQEKTSQMYSTHHWTEKTFLNLISELSEIELDFKRLLRNRGQSKVTEFMDKEHDRNFLNSYLGQSFAFLKMISFDEKKFVEFSSFFYSVEAALIDGHALSIKKLAELQLSLIGCIEDTQK